MKSQLGRWGNSLAVMKGSNPFYVPMPAELAVTGVIMGDQLPSLALSS